MKATEKDALPMKYQTFYDQVDEHGVSNREKLAQRQHIIRRVDTTAKDKSFEAAEGWGDVAERVALVNRLIGVLPETSIVRSRHSR